MHSSLHCSCKNCIQCTLVSRHTRGRFIFSIECSSRKYDLFTSQHNIGLYGFLAWKCLVYPMVFDSSNVCFWRRNGSFLVFAGQVEYHYMVYAVPLCSVYTDGNVFRASVYESNHFQSLFTSTGSSVCCFWNALCGIGHKRKS